MHRAWLHTQGLVRCSHHYASCCCVAGPCNYPPNYYSNKRWCCADYYHFDLSLWVSNTHALLLAIKGRQATGRPVAASCLCKTAAFARTCACQKLLQTADLSHAIDATYKCPAAALVQAYEKLADKKWGVIGIKYREVPCDHCPDNPATPPGGWPSPQVQSPPSGWQPSWDKRSNVNLHISHSSLDQGPDRPPDLPCA